MGGSCSDRGCCRRETYEPLEVNTQRQTNTNKKATNDEAIQGWIEAINSGNDNLAVCLLQDNVELENYIFEDGNNGLSKAILNDHNALAFELLDQGFNVNFQNGKNGNTPLHVSTLKNNVKMVVFLLENNSNIDIKNNNGKTALMISKEKNFKDIVQILDPSNFMEENINIESITHNIETNEEKDNEITYDSPIQTPEQTLPTKISPQISPEISPKISPKNSPETLGDISSDISGYISPDTSQKTSPNNAPTKDTKRQTETKKVFVPKLVKGKSKQVIEKLSTMTQEKQSLPVLEEWLEKKSPKRFVGYQKRFVVVKDNYLFWHDTKKHVINTSDIQERKTFKGCLNLALIQSIKSVETTSNNKFTIVAKDTIKNKTAGTREYLWRCKNTQQRTKWMDGLQKHRIYIKNMMEYLNDTSQYV